MKRHAPVNAALSVAVLTSIAMLIIPLPPALLDLLLAFDIMFATAVLVVAFGLVEPAKTLVAVMHGGEACQHLVGGLLGRVEFPGVDQGEHGIGRGVQLFVAVMA